MEDKNRCWKVLTYTKPRTNYTTLALQGPDNQITITMQAKKALIRAHAFPKAPFSQESKYKLGQRFAYLLVSQEMVTKALFCQLVKKTLGPNKHNFQALQLIWT